jgi:hypothetical protein
MSAEQNAHTTLAGIRPCPTCGNTTTDAELAAFREQNIRARTARLYDGFEFEPSSLVGSFFHSFEPDVEGQPRRVQWQGVVVAEPHPGIYLVETFDWLVGASYDQRVVRVEDMLGWAFYDDAGWMGNAYEQTYRRPEERREDAERATDGGAA